MHSLRNRLLLTFVLMVLLPMSIFSTVSGISSVKRGKETAVKQLETVVRFRQEAINLWLDSLKSELATALLSENIRWHSSVLLEKKEELDLFWQDSYNKIKEHLQKIKAQSNRFTGFFLVSPRGQIELATAPVPGWVALIGSHPDLVQLTTNQFFVLHNATPPYFTLFVLQPLFNEQQQIIGIIGGQTGMHRLTTLMNDRNGLGRTGETLALDEQGHLITGSIFELAHGKSAVTGEQLQQGSSQIGRYLTQTDYRHKKVSCIYQNIPELPLILLAKQDREEAFADTYKALILNSSIALAAVLAAILSGLLFTRHITAPLAELAASAERIQAGNMRERVSLQGGLELEHLGRAFNTMTERLNGLIEELRDEIIHRIEIAEELKRSQELLENTTKNIPGIVFRLHRTSNHQFHFPYVSEQVENLLALSRRRILKSPNAAFRRIVKEDRQSLIAALEKSSQTLSNLSHQFRIQTVSGETRWLQCFSSPDREGDGITWNGVILDITTRKMAIEALRESEEKYRLILESITDGYFELDIQGRFIFCNNAMATILGAERTLLIGQELKQFLPVEQQETVLTMLQTLKQNGLPINATEWQFLRPDGGFCFVECSVSLIATGEEELIGIRGMARDINERKLNEQENRKLQDQLRQAERMEAIGTLAGGIAHDFNNLLMGIQGRTSMMMMDTPKETHQRHLEFIEKYIKSASDLTRQLLGFARGGKYEVRATDLNELLEKHNQMFGRTRKEVSITERLQPDLWPVAVDQGQIEQVLVNLFVNAWQAMPDGGDIIVQTENIRLHSNEHLPFQVTPGPYIRLSVTDNGQGMDQTTKQHIFEPFFTTKQRGRGTGLGLASVYGIIKNHNGFIQVYSELGQGSTFAIYLPATSKTVEHQEEEKSALTMGSGMVLLVDDEEMITEVGSQMLEMLGYEYLIASSGQEAIKLYTTHQNVIDLVILDMIMPQQDGGQTFSELKRINAQVKVILSSGYSLNQKAEEIMSRGCIGFIQKPFNIEQLSEKIRGALQG